MATPIICKNDTRPPYSALCSTYAIIEYNDGLYYYVAVAVATTDTDLGCNPTNFGGRFYLYSLGVNDYFEEGAPFYSTDGAVLCTYAIPVDVTQNIFIVILENAMNDFIDTLIQEGAITVISGALNFSDPT